MRKNVNILGLFASLVLLIFASGQGCPGPDTPIPCGALETVGKVTATTATVKLVANEDCTPTVTFQLFYDVAPKQVGNYAHSTTVLTGFVEHDPIEFKLTSLTPDTVYYYRVAYGLNGNWLHRPEYSFRTQRP